MGQIQDTIAIYERLRQKKYKVTIEDGTSFVFSFEPKMYHHLVGYQHLTDIVALSKPQKKNKFYFDIKHGRITETFIINSSKYHEIFDRVQYFKFIEEIVSSGKGKVIVEFDKSKLSTDINAKYNLFKREGTSLSGDCKYYMLFIGYDDNTGAYFPATYIVEPSSRYVRNQTFLNCTIEEIVKPNVKSNSQLAHI